MNDSKIYFNKILSNYKKQHFRAGLLRDILIWIVLNSAFVIICLLLERIWFLSPAVKKILWALFSLNLLFPLRIFISAVTWFTGNANRDRRILLDLGSAFLDIQDKLYNHYQLSLKKNEFARFAVRRFMNTYPAQFFIKKAPRPFSPSLLRYTISLSLCAGLLIALFLPAGKRLIRPQTEFLPNLPYSISFMQNDTTIFAGDSLNFLVFKSAAPNFPLQLIQTRKGSQSPISFNIISDSLLSVGFGKIRSDLQITAAIRRPNIFYPRRFLATDTLRIQVLHRPRLESLEFKLVFPAYTRRYPEYYPGNIDRIKILPGTRVSISAELSAAAGPSHILYRESKIPFTILDRSLSCDILPDSSGRMIFHLQNSNSVRTENLPEYRIRVVPDRLPELSVLQPEKKELGLRSEKSLRILAEIRDDYGFAHAAIFYRKNSPYNREDSTFQHVNLPLQPELTLQLIDTLWDFTLIS